MYAQPSQESDEDYAIAAQLALCAEMQPHVLQRAGVEAWVHKRVCVTCGSIEAFFHKIQSALFTLDRALGWRQSAAQT